MEDIRDVIVVGGGPAGLYTAFYCGLRKMRALVIEAQTELGGKLNLYKDKRIWDVGGLIPTRGEALINQLIEQSHTFEPEILTGQLVIDIFKQAGVFVITTDCGNIYKSKSVILGTGSGIITPKQVEFTDKNGLDYANVHYEMTQLSQFKDKRVVVSGGGDSAVQWAKELSEVATRVIIVYRQDLFKGYEAEIDVIHALSNVECLMAHRLVGIETNQKGEITKMNVTRELDGKISCYELDDLVVCHGFDQNNPIIQRNVLELTIKDNHYVVSNHMCETDVSGLYVVGDAAHYDGKVHLIAGAFHDSVNAVNKAKQYVDPSAFERGQVSSHHDELQNRVC
ncbi:MAG: NAD(P)/FAD-dependent oxidoreductase [Vagococcus sp.]